MKFLKKLLVRRKIKKALATAELPVWFVCYRSKGNEYTMQTIAHNEQGAIAKASRAICNKLDSIDWQIVSVSCL